MSRILSDLRTGDEGETAADSGPSLPGSKRRGNVQPSSCILCGGPPAVSATIHPRRLPWLKKCPGCGLLMTFPQPSDAELARIYNQDYYGTFGYHPHNDHCFRRIKQKTFDDFLDVAESRVSTGRLLDVGSALGDMLVVGRKRGWDVWGVEPNSFAVEAADRLVPGRTFPAAIEDFDPTETEPFDLVCCSDVLEHLRRPDEALRIMRDSLRPGGVLLVVVPDAGSFTARGLGARWPHYHVDHLWHFNNNTLSALVRSAGLEIVFQGTARKTFNLAYLLGIVGNTPNFPAARFAARWGLRRLPARFLEQALPPIKEGLLLVSRRPGG